ncbi:acyltransferase [Sporosarcina sp. FSL K6-1508]|uniref:acyltransferase n=1 Tax=Sporosarcina sp. FSL K6-1508 TaxID=2921553 RepID=UPI0030FB2BD5
MSFFSQEELKKIGFGNVGKNVRVSKKASLYNPQNIFIGDNTRIDDFCVLSAGTEIRIGCNVHIAVFASLIGKGKIIIDDYAGISSRVSLYSSDDDYTGEYMTNPTIDRQYTNVTHGKVVIGRHVIIGSGSIVLPNVVIKEGACVAALSLVKENCQAFGVYMGVPAKKIKERSRKLIEIEEEFKQG